MSEWKKYLPLGTQQALARKFELSEPYISQILSGVRKHDIVLDYAISIAEKEKARRDREEKKREKRIQKLTAQ